MLELTIIPFILEEEFPEVCLMLILANGYLDLHVLAARNIPSNPEGLPDTFVQTCLTEGKRKFLKKKSPVIVGCKDPFFKFQVKYLASDLPRR